MSGDSVLPTQGELVKRYQTELFRVRQQEANRAKETIIKQLKDFVPKSPVFSIDIRPPIEKEIFLTLKTWLNENGYHSVDFSQFSGTREEDGNDASTRLVLTLQ
jgi:hypothetical protein